MTWPLIAFAARVLARPRSAACRRPVRKSARPSVEALEDRTVPSLITVTNLYDSGDGSLRWAVGEANRLTGADTIDFNREVFVTGTTIWLTSGQLSLTDTTGATTIDGHDASVTIDGNYLSRVFQVGTGVTAEMSGLTITGGRAVDNLSDYSTGNGGGIYNRGDLTVSGCVFTGNTADHEGGGIDNDSGGRLTVTGSTFSHNSAASGGGIDSRGYLTVSDSNLSYNSATFNDGGGGIGIAAGVVTVSGTTLSHNSATNGYGGGIFNSGSLTVSASTLSYNSAKNGGGIYNAKTMTVSNSTLSGNSATLLLGGGIFNNYGNMTISASTVFGNSALRFGGGIASYGPARVTLHNALVAGNHLVAGSPSDLEGTFDSASSYNLIGDGSGGLNPSLGNLLGTPSSLLDPKLGPLQNNGGPTWTHALLAGSPAINAGDPAILPAPDQYDQRGPGFARVSGGRIDIGAFEVQAVTAQQHLADVASDVRAFVSQGTLPPGVGRSIMARVDAARALLARGNTTPVVKMLEAFSKQVGGLRQAGKLTAAQAQFLIDAAQRAIDSVKLQAAPLPTSARDAVFAEMPSNRQAGKVPEAVKRKP